MESKSNKILICTPLEGIAKVRERLESLSEIIYEPDIDIDFFENNNQDNVVGIFTNPNRSKIFFSDNVLGKLKNLKFNEKCVTTLPKINLIYHRHWI